MAENVDQVSIIIPTLNRPQPLRRALASIAAQRLPDDIHLEVVVVDNSTDGSAHWIAAQYPTMRYLSEPVPGVANARNAGVNASKGRWVAFLDDDEEAVPDWIAQHVENLRRTGADASFGPVQPCAEAQQVDADASFITFFERQMNLPSGSDITSKVAYLGTNNSVFGRAACLAATDPFDISLNETGGEDSLLLQQLVQRGRRFSWASAARVTEWVPAKRLNWDYVTRRRFLSGQIRTFVQYMLEPPRWDRVVFWMAIGAAQGALWSLFALVALDRQRSLHARSKAWGGWGKVLWAKRFRPRLYGSGLVS